MKVFVVMCVMGEYSYASFWPVAVYRDRALAESHASVAQKIAHDHYFDGTRPRAWEEATHEGLCSLLGDLAPGSIDHDQSSNHCEFYVDEATMLDSVPVALGAK